MSGSLKRQSLRWGVVVPLTVSSVVLYRLVGAGLVQVAVHVLGKSEHRRGGVGYGIWVHFYFCVYVLFCIAVAAVAVGGAGAPWQRKAARVVGALGVLALLPWLTQFTGKGWTNPNWSLIHLVSYAVGLAVPNVIALRLVRAPPR